MMTFFKLADALFTAGGLWIVWQFAVAARAFTSPAPDKINEMIRVLGKLHADLERLNGHFGNGVRPVLHQVAEGERDIKEH